jgi:toxin ParE1/3/4
MNWRVVFSDAAQADLAAIQDYISERAGPAIATRFVESIVAYCLNLATMPERGTRREDLRPRLRTVGYRRRATIVFEVDHAQHRVAIHGVLYAGRQFEGRRLEDETD